MPKKAPSTSRTRNRALPFASPAVKELFASYAPGTRACLLQLRQIIFDVAKATPTAGRLEETVRWGQPSYLTPESKSGTTLRIDAVRDSPGIYALYVHCQTTLIANFRKRFGHKLQYESNRALLFSSSKPFPEAEVRECVLAALTYHLKTQSHRVPVGNLIR